jgi:hypothetical protein
LIGFAADYEPASILGASVFVSDQVTAFKRLLGEARGTWRWEWVELWRVDGQSLVMVATANDTDRGPRVFLEKEGK